MVIVGVADMASIVVVGVITAGVNQVGKVGGTVGGKVVGKVMESDGKVGESGTL